MFSAAGGAFGAAGASGAGARLASPPFKLLTRRTRSSLLLSAAIGSVASVPGVWLAASSTGGGFPDTCDPAKLTTSRFSLRVASMIARIADCFSESDPSASLIKSMRSLALSTFSMIVFLALTIVVTLSRNIFAEASSWVLTPSRSVIRLSRAPLAAVALPPDQIPTPLNIWSRCSFAASSCEPTVVEVVSKASAQERSLSSSTSGHAGGAVIPCGSDGLPIPIG